METGRKPQPRPVPALPNPSYSSPDSHPERVGSTWSKRTRQPEPPQDAHEFPHRVTPNQDTDIEHMSPDPNAMNPLPTGAHPTGELHLRKADIDKPTQPAPATSCPHHKVHCAGKARQGPGAMPPQPPPTGAKGQTSLSTAPTTEPLTHTKMGQTHLAGAPRPPESTQGRCPPPRPPQPHKHTTSPPLQHNPGRNINQLSTIIAAQPIQMPVTPYPRRGHNKPTPHALQSVRGKHPHAG
ncbi:hypothetical protein AMECASPLE_007989 [Ameca splendens]|uniref:Uncharacterized protein n=1 Tax=Ameca splendens TaxID=208324 RepID=A0ABV0XZX2_9TELE